MSKTPLISIIVPVHNTEEYVSRTVESLRRQTVWDDVEVILVENGSTDGSLKVCRALAAEAPERIRLLVNAKVGLSEARNFGVKYARGEYVMFVDSDDFIDPEMCEKLLRAKTEHNADIAICNYILNFEDGRTEHKFPDTGQVSLITPEQCAFNTIMEIHTSASWVRLYDRSFFDSRRFPEGMVFEDHDTVYRWMSEMKRIVYVDAPLYHYCVRRGSITTSTNSSPAKILDHFRAECNRLPFVMNEARFTSAQKKVAIRHTARELHRSLKNFIALKPNCMEWYSDTQLQQLLASFLSETEKFSVCTLGFHATTRRMMIKYCPKYYFRKYNFRKYNCT